MDEINLKPKTQEENISQVPAGPGLGGEESQPGFLEKIKNWFQQQKKSTLIIGGISIVVVIVLGVVIWLRYFASGEEGAGDKSLLSPLKKAITKKVPSEISKLDGLEYATNANRHPLGIMIENHPDARPQSGLDKASIVYEAITEGGITRFLAIFGPSDAPEIGPVRSARSFYVDWIQEYDGFYAHAGGAPDALQKIVADGVFDLPHTKGYFERQPQAGIASEHTLYTSTADLYKLAKEKGYTDKADYDNLTFKDEAKTEDRGDEVSVEINFSSESYLVKWVYDKTSNTYSRFLAGLAHKDRKSGSQITAKSVIVQTVERTPLSLPGAKPTFQFYTEKGGSAKIFQDGKMADATWKKEGKGKRTKFFDASGDEIKVNRGQRWYEIVPPETPVSETKNTAPATPTPSSATTSSTL